MECFPTFLGSKLPYICQHILAFLAAQNRQFDEFCHYFQRTRYI